MYYSHRIILAAWPCNVYNFSWRKHISLINLSAVQSRPVSSPCTIPYTIPYHSKQHTCVVLHGHGFLVLWCSKHHTWTSSTPTANAYLLQIELDVIQLCTLSGLHGHWLYVEVCVLACTFYLYQPQLSMH